MQGPSVDKDLLKRFHQDDCSPEERQRVLAWLETDDEDEEGLLLEEVPTLELEERIWKNINPEKIRRLNTRRFIALGGMAASLLLISSFFLFRYPQRDADLKTYIVGGDRGNTIELGGLKFRTVGNSNATVSSDHDTRTGKLTFCGVIEISNETGADVNYTVRYACQANGHGLQKVVLKKGGSYVAMKGNDNEKQLIIMRKERLYEFPDALPTGLERI